MYAADIDRRKSMVAVIQTCQLFERTYLLPPFNPVHLTLAGDVKEVLQHSPTRARLELILLEYQICRSDPCAA